MRRFVPLLQLLVFLAALAPATVAAQVVSASKLIGAAVLDKDGHDLGHITDLAIDPVEGRVAYVMLYANGHGLTGEQVYGVALQALRPALRQDALVLDRAAAAPHVQAPRLMRAKELLGKDVNDPAGRRIGDIVDLAVHLDSGQVAHALLQTREGPARELPLGAFAFPADGGDALLTSTSRR